MSLSLCVCVLHKLTFKHFYQNNEKKKPPKTNELNLVSKSSKNRYFVVTDSVLFYKLCKVWLCANTLLYLITVKHCRVLSCRRNDPPQKYRYRQQKVTSRLVFVIICYYLSRYLRVQRYIKGWRVRWFLLYVLSYAYPIFVFFVYDVLNDRFGRATISCHDNSVWRDVQTVKTENGNKFHVYNMCT